MDTERDAAVCSPSQEGGFVLLCLLLLSRLMPTDLLNLSTQTQMGSDNAIVQQMSLKERGAQCFLQYLPLYPFPATRVARKNDSETRVN